MISLIEILLENNPTSSPEEEEIADGIGNELANILRQRLRIAGKQVQSQSNTNVPQNVPQNEAILTITALAIIASIPGYLKAVSKIGESISRKQGLDLTKNKGSEAWYSVLGKFVDKIESYIDTPFNLMLTPFIKDEVKRKKITGIIKAASIITLAIIGGINFTKAPEALEVVKRSAGEFAGELITKNADNIVTTVKFIIKKVIVQ